MDKVQLQTQKLAKACFGTKEWSQNSGICGRCELEKDCRKVISDKE